MESVEIFFDDLSKEKQQELLEAAGAKDRDDMNWGVFPVTVVGFEPDEENNEDDSNPEPDKENT